MNAKALTKREKAIIYALAAGQIETWQEAYILANQRPEEEIRRQSAIRSTVSRWKMRAEIVTAYENARAILAAHDQKTADDATAKAGQDSKQEEKKDLAGDSVSTKQKARAAVAGPVDYTNPAEQARKLNELINTASDPGEALDALKVIISSQRADKEAAKEGKRVLFYAPLRCRDCPLYAKAREKREKSLQ